MTKRLAEKDEVSYMPIGNQGEHIKAIMVGTRRVAPPYPKSSRFISNGYTRLCVLQQDTVNYGHWGAQYELRLNPLNLYG